MKCSLLVAEDDDADIFLLRRAFTQIEFPLPLEFVRDGQEAVDYLQRQRMEEDDRLPDLIILDLKMPRLSGLEVLHWLRQQPVLHTVPAFLFSSSDRREDVERAYALGANGYMIKPPSVAERCLVASFIRDWLRFNQQPLASLEGFRSAQSAHLAHRFKDPLAL